MHIDPAMPIMLAILMVLLGISLVGVLSKQPVIIAYLIAGVVIGPAGLGLILDVDLLSRVGAAGVVLLLFFVGMEISPAKIKSKLWLAGVGTLLQIGVTVALLIGIGKLFDWSIERSILIGFVVALSSTAVILKLLDDWKIINTRTGQDVLAILLAQDIAVVPMILCIGYMAGDQPEGNTLGLQAIGALCLLGIAVFSVMKKNIRLPFGKYIRENHELQVLTALSVCFGLALISGLFDLSTALGAFVGGMLIHATKDTNWVESSLLSFKIIFIALFFVSVGLMVNIEFLKEHLLTVLLVAFLALLINTALNTIILRAFRRSWKESLYGGALLAQIGEFSFVLGAIGYKSGVINAEGHQLITLIIVCTLLLSPAWVIGIQYASNRYLPNENTPMNQEAAEP